MLFPDLKTQAFSLLYVIYYLCFHLISSVTCPHLSSNTFITFTFYLMLLFSFNLRLIYSTAISSLHLSPALPKRTYTSVLHPPSWWSVVPRLSANSMLYGVSPTLSSEKTFIIIIKRTGLKAEPWCNPTSSLISPGTFSRISYYYCC